MRVRLHFGGASRSVAVFRSRRAARCSRWRAAAADVEFVVTGTLFSRVERRLEYRPVTVEKLYGTQLTKRRRRTLIASPSPKHVATTDVEPKLIRGSGIPIIGKSRMTIPTLTATW